MPEPSQRLGRAQASNVTFDLHTLGWEAFQNLCCHVAQEVLGQTVTVFSPTNDAGKDGAFQGVWKRTSNEIYTGSFILQCKFTSRRDEHLSLSLLTDELAKAEKLAAKGFIQTYLLITNARVSGMADVSIRKAFSKIPRLEFFDILGEEWLTQQILKSKRLRAFVPRIYGLGDLTQILDARAYAQADEILQSWGDNLTKFVPTGAHERSVHALLNKGFVILLGDPMAGKSTIAASLALAAADQWNCLPVFVAQPEDFQAHYNPAEPKQFFWVDDAFGQTQFNPALAERWSRQFPLMGNAIKRGVRVLFTSRTYIFNSASREIKKSSFPLISDSQVIIEVEKFTLREKERILYNHLRLGNQPVEFRRAIKPHLAAVAADPKFFPEVARRLGDPFFTRNLAIEATSLARFVGEPRQFLRDVIEQLDRSSFAAIALLFMRAGKVSIPLDLQPHEEEAAELLGTKVSQLREALGALEGSLVNPLVENGAHFWRFRHPTIRDAMASYVAEKPDLLDIYLHGVEPKELLEEIVCGDIHLEGAKVHVPPSRFDLVVAKLKYLDLSDGYTRHTVTTFLQRRCSIDFLRAWVTRHPAGWHDLFHSPIWYNDRAIYRIAAQLHTIGILSPEDRTAYVSRASDALVSEADGMFVDSDLQTLLTSDEFEELLNQVIDEVIPMLDTMIEYLIRHYDIADDPEDHFATIRENIEELRNHFRYHNFGSRQFMAIGRFDAALDSIDKTVEHLQKKQEIREAELIDEKQREEDARFEQVIRDAAALGVTLTPKKLKALAEPPPEPSNNSAICRSIFDDVDA